MGSRSSRQCRGRRAELNRGGLDGLVVSPLPLRWDLRAAKSLPGSDGGEAAATKRERPDDNQDYNRERVVEGRSARAPPPFASLEDAAGGVAAA